MICVSSHKNDRWKKTKKQKQRKKSKKSPQNYSERMKTK